MPEASRKFAFVSGKGGVGKTLLAANFAFCCSTNLRTVLVDLDFQNQGASGLLAEFTRPGCANAFDLLKTGLVDADAIIEVRNSLFFIPAFDPRRSDRFGAQSASALFELSSVERFGRIMDDLAAAGKFDAMLIDCHGGLDDNSFSAFIYSDTTFIVSEADKVTFSGTLELLDFYVDRARAISGEWQAAPADQAAAPIRRRLVHIEDNQIEFLINRVSGKFEYDSLRKILAKQFKSNIEFLGGLDQAFYFFPADPIIAESFSEYPFLVELLPESIFSQKIELLYEKTTGLLPVIRGRSRLYGLFERIRPNKLERLLKSPYDTRVRAVFSFVAITQALIFVLVVSLVPIGIMSEGQTKSLQSFGQHYRHELTFLALLALAIFLFYMASFNLQVSRFFRDRLRYELRLHLKGARRISITFSLRIVRAFLFRVVPLLWGAMYFILAFSYGIASFVALFVEL